MSGGLESCLAFRIEGADTVKNILSLGRRGRFEKSGAGGAEKRKTKSQAREKVNFFFLSAVGLSVCVTPSVHPVCLYCVVQTPPSPLLRRARQQQHMRVCGLSIKSKELVWSLVWGRLSFFLALLLHTTSKLIAVQSLSLGTGWATEPVYNSLSHWSLSRCKMCLLGLRSPYMPAAPRPYTRVAVDCANQSPADYLSR